MRLAGRYELEQRLAEGGMAEVWLATSHGDAGFTRRVAIKQLFPHPDDGGAFERMFLDEARITSQLHHASIVSILDFGVEAGRAFQVLELIDGFDAWKLTRRGRELGAPMPLPLALHVCSVVGHALHYAHTRTADDGTPLRIVHRDVSPQNILLARTGDVKLSDFGIALAEGRTEKTVGGVARGKPAYMAPEQAIRGPLDGRTDVFALGCVLHALLTGESALRDENALVDLLSGTELTLSPSLGEDVRALIAKATRRNKAERYESAEEMAIACEQLRATQASEEPRRALAAWVQRVAPPPGAAATSVRTPSSPPPLATPVTVPGSPSAGRARSLGFVVGGLALGLLGVAGWKLANPEPPQNPVPLAVAPAPLPVEPPPAPAPPTPVPTEPAATPAPVATAKKPVVAPAKPPVAEGTGLISVGGEAFLRAEVFVDGAPRGFAPARLELPVGPHSLELVLANGQRRKREVVVSRLHTPSAPWTWVED
ncbi:MAG: serine/threonine-protein kinase [Myxococcaceae bacterium]